MYICWNVERGYAIKIASGRSCRSRLKLKRINVQTRIRTGFSVCIRNAAIGLVNIANSLRGRPLFTKLISLCNANFGPATLPGRTEGAYLAIHSRGKHAANRRRRWYTFSRAFCLVPPAISQYYASWPASRRRSAVKIKQTEFSSVHRT